MVVVCFSQVVIFPFFDKYSFFLPAFNLIKPHNAANFDRNFNKICMNFISLVIFCYSTFSPPAIMLTCLCNVDPRNTTLLGD